MEPGCYHWSSSYCLSRETPVPSSHEGREHTAEVRDRADENRTNHCRSGHNSQNRRGKGLHVVYRRETDASRRRRKPALLRTTRSAQDRELLTGGSLVHST